MKKTKLLSLFLAAVLCLGLASPALALEYGEEYRGYTTSTAQQYRDVDDAHWAKASIETCSQRSWFNGYPDGTFRPEGLITREEAAKVFAVAMGLEIETDPTVTYTDTKDNWAKAYIEATKPLFPNVANLQGTSSFRPKQTITREETIYALVVAWGYGSKTKNADLSILNMFSDTGSISAGVKPYLAVAVSEGLVSGLPDGTIAAQKGLTRAEFATLLARALSHGYGDTKQEFQAPAIALDKYSATTTEAKVSVTGTVTPADATLALDGKSVRAGKDGSFTLELELEVGKNTFTLTAENAYGTKDSKTISVERAEEAVSIRILSDVPETTEAATLAVNGKVENWSDACTLLLDNSRVSVDKDGYFQLTLQLEEGRNAFALTVARGQKEVGAATIQVTRTAPPEPSDEATTKPSEKPSADPAEGSSSQGDTSGRKVIGTSGCGDDLVWTLYEDGEMVISGTGKMSNYTNYGMIRENKAPWKEHIDKITTLTIEKGVTTIGDSAFIKGKNISKVTIPDGVTYIGEEAFSDCKSLTDITLPESVTSFGGENVFAGCAFTEIKVPSKIQTIPFGTFQNCQNLTTVILPSGLDTIEACAFSRCTALKSINLPSGLRTLGEDVFRESGLTSIRLGSVTSAGNHVFWDCKNLAEASLGELTEVPWGMFSGCESLKEIFIPYGTTAIGANAFHQCYDLMIVYIPETVTQIEDAAFDRCPNLTNVYYGGDARDWANINIGNWNDDLLAANLREW